MTVFRPVGVVATGYARNITDISLGQVGNRIVLVGATHAGGGLSIWDVTTPGARPALIASHAYPDVLLHRAEPQAVLLDRPGGMSVMPGGIMRGCDYVRAIGQDGAGWAPDGGVIYSPLPADLLDAGDFRTWQGSNFTYVTQMARPWFTLWREAANGTLVKSGNSAVPPGLAAGSQIDAIEHARMGGVDLVLSASIRGNFIAAHRVLPDGSLAPGEYYVMARGAGFNGPRDLAAVEVEGRHFVVVSSAGSSSLTTVRILPGGALVPVDHIIDERSTRFQSATVMEAVSVDGRTFIIAGGADDGLSLFTLTPDGRLIHLDTIADGPWTSLADVSALAVRAIGGQLVIFAASATETGVSQLLVPLGPIGQTRHVREGTHAGTEQGDLIQGGAGTTLIDGRGGDDILIAGPGASALVGGSGADVFIPTADVTKLVIRDFEVGVDRLDLSMMGMIRSVTQIAFVSFSLGIKLRFGARVIEVRSSDGRPIQAGIFDDSMFPIAHYQPPDVRTTVLGTMRADLIAATRGGTTIIASGGNDTLLGSHLEDRLLGDHGHDRIFGNDGDDTLWGGRGLDYLRGGAMNDLIYGGYDNDIIQGESGDDLLVGQDGNDFIWGGDGADRLNGGWGDDQLFGGAGNDMIHGLQGNDRLVGGDGHDYLVDTVGDNVFQDAAGRNRMVGGTGRDRMYGGVDPDYMRPGHGDDFCVGGGGDDDINSGNGNDTLVGGDGADLLIGGSGNDRIYGGAGNDNIQGGNHDDWLVGHGGNDRMFGGSGSDVMIAWDGNDQLRGDGGADRLYGNEGDDTLDGGDGNDQLQGHAGADRLIGGAGRDLLVGWQGDDTLDGGLDSDSLFGNSGADFLSGGDGHDLINGGIDHDTLNGGTGNDTLVGMAGDDRLTGGAGRDELSGGQGRDVFVFAAPVDSTTLAPDRVTDFETGIDRLDFSALHLTNIRDAGFSGIAGEMRWVSRDTASADWVVEIDIVGDGRADMVILIRATGGLGADDFLL